MRVPGWVVMASVVAVSAAAADPKPTVMDTKAFREKLQWFQDAQGGTYAVLAASEPDGPQVFYGKGKGTELFSLWITGGSTDGEAQTWEVGTWTPRLPDIHHGSIRKKPDGTYLRDCDGLDDAGLAPITGEKAKKLAADARLMTPFMDRIPRLLARDDAGVYYYVDRLRHGEGYRVFVGKKGAMKQIPLTDVAIDEAGDVYATKSGDLRLVRSNGGDVRANTGKWVHGEKAVELRFLDTDAASVLIFKELGIYGVLGGLCDNA